MIESETNQKTNKELFFDAVRSGDFSLLRDVDQYIPESPGVYCIFNAESTRLYIGSSVNVKTRITKHFSELRYGNHACAEMNIHFLQSNEPLQYFLIEAMEYRHVGEKSKNLLMLEAKMMLTTPKEMLYNNLIPVLCSGDGEFNTDAIANIQVSDICRNIDMTADAIRANGLSFSDTMTIDQAIEFVRKRTVATGRWTAEKAEKAILYMAELEKIKSDSNVQISWEGRPKHEKEPFREQLSSIYNEMYPEEKKRADQAQGKAGKTPASNVEPVIPAIQVEPIQAVSKQGSTLLLWSCLLLSLACSVPNMYGVALAMKGNVLLAGLVTGAFTVAPFLLIAYGIKGPLQYAAYVPILVEIFCNSAGFFGGMTGLGHSLYVEPTPFLHMVTSMMNSANEPTAFLLALCMAVCIAILAIVPVYEIEKRGK